MKNEIIKKSHTSPFKVFNEMGREMDRLMETMWKSPGAFFESSFFPSCEVTEKKDLFMITFDLPGIPKEEIKVDLKDRELRIYGERKSEHEKGEYTERRYGKFERVVNLPNNIDLNQVEATFDNGVLSVSFKKTGDLKVRRLDITSGKSPKETQSSKVA